MVNQIRLCPGETQSELVEYCKNRGMLLEAYSPLGTGKIFSVEQMKALAQKYNRSKVPEEHCADMRPLEPAKRVAASA